MKCKYAYKRDIKKVFTPENYNVREAIGRTNSLINRLKRQDGTAMNDFVAQIKKKNRIGDIGKDEWRKGQRNISRTSSLYLPWFGCKWDLISTDLRKINDTNTNVPGSATTYAIENTCPANPIWDSFNVQTQFSLHKYPYTYILI